MGERFSIPRPCSVCGKLFTGRDRKNKPAQFCSKRCHFLSKADKDWQVKAGKAAGALNILRLRGTGRIGYIKEYGRHQHRIVMEKKIGRKLTSKEIIHHIDGNKHNNHPDNLQLVTRSEHAKIHLTSLIRTSGKFSKRKS